jgi:hypothetical protein
VVDAESGNPVGGKVCSVHGQPTTARGKEDQEGWETIVDFRVTNNRSIVASCKTHDSVSALQRGDDVRRGQPSNEFPSNGLVQVVIDCDNVSQGTYLSWESRLTELDEANDGIPGKCTTKVVILERTGIVTASWVQARANSGGVHSKGCGLPVAKKREKSGWREEKGG